MRNVTGVTVALGAVAMVFSSCTCQKQISEPVPTFQDRPSGFHAETNSTPHVRAAAPTVSPAAPEQVAAAPTAAPNVPLPDDFPADLPVYKGAAVSQVQQLANNAHNVLFTTAAPVKDVAQFYDRQLSEKGWKVTQQFNRANHAFATYKKGNLTANVTVAEDARTPGQQIIAIMYEEEKPLEFEEF